ncbi:MAG: site-specific integrase [Desulfitobacteriaceae bacterium]
MEFVQPIRDKKALETMKKILIASNIRDYCLFILGINSGLRISDLLTLQVADVFVNGKIKDRIVIREKKTNKLKDFPLGETSKKALKEYLDTLKPGQSLFPSRKGNKPITRQQAYRILNDAARSIGIKDQIGTHSLRKTFGYHAFQAGVDITRIQKLLNHSLELSNLV